MGKTTTPKKGDYPDDADAGPCGVKLPTQDPCCESPCDPPWRTDEQCLIWYEQKYFIVPLKGGRGNEVAAGRAYIEFRITYEHRLCLLGKQHGPLLYTVTLLPREKVTLYHSERFRHITTTQDRFSVQTTFTQFASLIHEARVTASLDTLQERLANVKSGSSASIGGGLAGLIGLPSGGTASEGAVTDHNVLKLSVGSSQFNQSIVQA